MTKNIIKKIKKTKKLALFHHVDPDGDSLSSSYGLALALKKAYPDKEIKVVANKGDLFKRFPFIDFREDMFIDKINGTWTTMIGDTSIINRIDRSEEFKKGNFTICFDHHQSTTDYKYDLIWVESDWIASSMQAVEIAKATGVNFDEEIAFHLAIGILTDSGNFVFSRGQAHPVKIYGFLLNYISDKKMDHLFNSLKNKTKTDIEIEKYILNNMKFKGKLTYLKVFLTDVYLIGATPSEFKIKVNKLGNIEGYDRWAIFQEITKNGQFYIKISSRSIGPNVQSVAVKHQGGGHIRAAGMKANSWEEADKIIEELVLLPSK